MNNKYALRIINSSGHGVVRVAGERSGALIEKAEPGATYEIVNRETGNRLERVAFRRKGKHLAPIIHEAV